MRPDPRLAPTPAGTIFLLSSGEYSDYSPIGIFRALKDIHWPTIVDHLEESARTPDNDTWGTSPNVDDSAVAAYLTSSGHAEDITYQEIHIGSYGRLDPSIHKS